MKLFPLLSIAFLISTISYSQNTVTGKFTALSGQMVKLTGFEGFNTRVIDSVKVSEQGYFTLSFGRNDYGMGCLAAGDNKPFFVILAPGENVSLEGETLALPETVVVKSGKQNQLFEKYAKEHPGREQTLSAWLYLKKIYGADPLFASRKIPKRAIEKEIRRIKSEDKDFLAKLPRESFVSWYLPVRKLISSVPVVAQYRTEDIPESIEAFRAMDYTGERLWKSGLLKDAIESHFWLIENSGRSLDSVYTEMKISINRLLENLKADEKKFSVITGHLFNYLEKRSLFEASEYLALKVLNETHCTIDNTLASQLESYRAMKKGNIAPDFNFSNDIIAPGYEITKQPKKLSDIKSNYIVVVFGASWCPQCPQELSTISAYYKKWHEQSVEVVFVSLDEDEKIFKNFTVFFPFISICDYQKWESPIVKKYHVFATPTFYLLDSNRKILLRPNSVSQLNSWIDWYLVQGNK